MGQQAIKQKPQTDQEDLFEFEVSNGVQTKQQRIRTSINNAYLARQQINDPENQSDRYHSNEKNIELKEEDWKLMKSQVEFKQPYNKEQLLEGILEKQSPTVFSSWSKRYCTLKNGHFIYNENAGKESQMAGNLNFNLLSCSLIFNAQKMVSFKIQIASSTKTFVFRGIDKKQTQKWADLIRLVIDKSLGKQFNLSYLSSYHRFWRKQYFSEEQFRKTAEIGDLILFRGKKTSAYLQRALTFQQYDHVAIILKNIKNQVLLFEANGITGVGVIPWRGFINKQWYKDQQIVVFRKLHLNRTEQFYSKVESFVSRNIGKKYNFSVKKMIMNRNSKPQSQCQKGKTSYFCSSLVASLYKYLGLIDQQISSSKYLPHNFSQNGKLKLLKNQAFGNCYLGRQKIIVFQERFFQKI